MSADAIADYMMTVDQPAALVAQSNWVGSANLHRSVYQGGAYRQGLFDGYVDDMGGVLGLGRGRGRGRGGALSHQSVRAFGCL